jgi:hypothetical protein
VSTAGTGCGKAVFVEARCGKCRCFNLDDLKISEEHKAMFPANLRVENGICHRYPKTLLKLAADWCWEFQPVVED